MAEGTASLLEFYAKGNDGGAVSVAQRVAQSSFAVHIGASIGQVRGETEEGAFEIGDLDISEMMFQALIHLFALDQRHYGQGPVIERMAVDKGLAHAFFSRAKPWYRK